MAAETAREFVVRKENGRELLSVIKKDDVSGAVLTEDSRGLRTWLTEGTYKHVILTDKFGGGKPESKRKSVGEFTVDIDCSEALTGLKAIQREAKEATKALRELEEAQDEVNTKVNVDVDEVSRKVIEAIRRHENRSRGGR